MHCCGHTNLIIYRKVVTFTKEVQNKKKIVNSGSMKKIEKNKKIGKKCALRDSTFITGEQKI
jgi:hypothetical protein